MYLSTLKRKWLLATALGLAAGFMGTQALAHEGGAKHHKGMHWPEASLQAEASAVVKQDTVKITLASELTGDKQTDVAQSLNKVLESVMADARKDADVKASSGNYRIWPATDKDGKITTWHGRAEVLLESTNFEAASKLAGALSDRMPVTNLRFFVSPELEAKQEKALLVSAVRAFRARAQALTDALGYSSYRINKISVDGQGAGYQPAPRMMAMAAAKSSVPLEASTQTVTVSVRGSIFLRSPKK
jgi:predicted secreted protein